MITEKEVHLNLIRYLRRQMGMTQRDLSEKIGVSVNTISAWEKGKAFPDLPNAFLLAYVLGEDVSILFPGLIKFAWHCNNAS